MAELPVGDPQAQRNAGIATASLVLGVISVPTTCVCVGPVLGILAIVLGAVGVRRARRQPQLYAGRGRAAGGIATGSISLGLGLLLIVFVGVFAKSFSGMFHTIADTTRLEAALKAYEQVHHDYPPDLATLAAEGLVQPDPLNPSGSADGPFPGFKYVQDVHPSDPPSWILAYQPMTVGPMRAVSLIYANGHRDVLEASVFEQALAAFRKEYEAARGSPPQVLPAEDKP
jgi:hypothetical protein